MPSADRGCGSQCTRARGTALVGDDDGGARRALALALERAGYAIAASADVAQAVAVFFSTRADVVFLAANALTLDLREAIRRVRTCAGGDFVPVVVTGPVEDPAVLAHSLDAGGDDFLARPIDERVLSAKLRALEHIRGLHTAAAQTQARARADWEIAQSLLGEVVMGPNARSPALRAQLVPADAFSADLFLAEYCPSGDLNVLLGDFTGHGLAAALAALPTAETFRSMTAKGFAPRQLLLEMNRKLKAQLPTGRFLAAAFVRVSRSLERIWVANCGMPDVLVIGAGAIRKRIRSASLPLGIDASLDPGHCLRPIAVTPGERVVLASDGAHEALNASGEQFGPARFDRAVAHGAVPGLGVVGALDAFLAGAPAGDDVSVVEISLTQQLFESCSTPVSAARAPVQPGAGGQWRIALDLQADALRTSDPVPMVLAQLQQIPGLEAHRPMLYTVLSELYRNALEHGVLRLDSRLKDQPEGFERYVAARERGLTELTTGSVRLSVTCVQEPGGGHLTIRVEDSGPGFDWAALPRTAPSGAHGRGLHLVRALCSALTFEQGGRCALATYPWGDAER